MQPVVNSYILRFFALCIFTGITTIGRAQFNFTKVDNWLNDNATTMGGRVFLVVYKDGKIIHSYAVNDMNRRQKVAGRFIAKRQGNEPSLQDYTSSTRQPIASCSKWLSAALVMTFVDEGKIKLTDTVGRYLPVLSKHGKGKITISQCLAHLTGIKTPEIKQSLKEMRKTNSMDEAIEHIAALPVEGEPGKVFHYSNAGLQIAGAVIEKISGKSFETLFAERIAAPLNMKNTDFGKGPVALPAGGANSTPDDYINFLIMILNKGVYNGHRILSESSVAAMEINQVTKDVKVANSPAEAGNFGYGYGEWVMENSTANNISKAVCSPGLFGSFPWIDNEKKYTAFLMAFNLKINGRHDRYITLKQLVDEAVQ